MPRVARADLVEHLAPSECGGSTQALSPEWMPASSTCCMIPPTQTSSPSQSASTSTSIAFSRKRSRKISRRAVARVAAEVVGQAVARVDDLHRAAAEHVATGGRAAGSRPRRPAASASSIVVRGARRAAPCSPAARAASPKRPRSSARSIESTLVPRIGTPASCEPGGQLERRLAAELDDDALGLLDVDDAEHVLERQRLEVQAVGGVVVGGDRLGVAVDHHRVAAATRARSSRRARSSSRTRCPGRCGSGPRRGSRRSAAVAALDLVGGLRAPSPSRSTASRPANSAAQVSTALNERSPANGAAGSRASACSSRRNHGSISWRRATCSTRRALAEGLEHHVEAVRGRALEHASSVAASSASSAGARRARASASPWRTPGRTCARWPSPRRPTSCASTARRRRPGTSRTRSAAT